MFPCLYNLALPKVLGARIKKLFIYQPRVYLEANGKSSKRYVCTGDRANVHPDCFMCIDDLQNCLIEGMTKLYIDDYELSGGIIFLSGMGRERQNRTSSSSRVLTQRRSMT